MLYTLNLYNVVYRLYLSKAGKGKIMNVSNALVEKKHCSLSRKPVSVPDMIVFCSVLLGKMWYNITVVTIYASFVSIII